MKKPVSGKKPLWFNGRSVDDEDLGLEQNYNDLVQTSIISNHFGTGVIPDSPNQNVIFDSDLSLGLLDGKAFNVQKQPTDPNFGNQIDVSLDNSKVSGKRTLKLLVIGLDFEGNLQYDAFTFHKNESQISKKHYTRILKIIFNDYIGDPSQSFNLGGRLVIKEAKSVLLSRDCVMVAQNVQPNLFFRDFFLPPGKTLNAVLAEALPTYNIDSLNINSEALQTRDIVENDVISQIGQKFEATTNNIQKITLLMSVSNSVNPTDLEWTGDLIVSLYPLQSSVDCPLDIAPGTAIDFDPSNIPLAQLSLNYNSLLNAGVELGETAQPVDFIFSNTQVGAGNLINAGLYYVISVKRAGSADKCVIKLTTGADHVPNSRLTLFNGTIWVDVPDEDLWFEVYTDSSKVSDGQAYDNGHGIIVPKTKINEQTGLTEDYCLEDIQFSKNDTYYAVLEAVSELSVPTQDQRTGERVLSQQQLVPQLSLITGADLISREVASDPLVIGSIADQNMKLIAAGTINVPGKFHAYGIVGNECIIKVIDDPADGYRYDLDILNLVSEMTGSGGISNINGLINGKFTPNVANPSTFYRISETELISMMYGDLNGDGVVDELDLLEFTKIVDSDLNQVPSAEEYITFTTLFADDLSLQWQLLDSDKVSVLDSGSDGYLIADPQDKRRAVFGSSTGNFSSVDENENFIKILNNTGNPGNNGIFRITSLINNTAVEVEKQFYDSDHIMKIMRADINGDMIVDGDDLSLLTNYIHKVAPFPNSSSPANKIGTIFNVIRFTLEQYVDRADDYTASADRSEDLHPIPDIVIDGYNAGFPLYGLDLETSPLEFSIGKQLTWYDYFVASSSNPKLVPVSFNYQSGFVLNDCSLPGITAVEHPSIATFDKGKNDAFVPDNLVINAGGAILNNDGYFHKIDMEIGTVILEFPTLITMNGPKTINIFTDFVADFTGNGRTRLGYKCMRFADCSTVGLGALNDQQVRFDVSLQSLSPTLDGYDVSNTLISGIIVDNRNCVSLNYETGLLTVNINNVYEDIVDQSIKTKIQIIVYLKRGGFNNDFRIVTSEVAANIFGDFIIP